MAVFRAKTFILALILSFNACFEHNFKAINTEKIYNFTFNKLDNKLDFSHNKAFALIFFTKDCGLCKEQIHIVKELKKSYDFDFLAVLADAKDKEDARIWALEKELDLPLFYERKASAFLAASVGGIYGVPVIVFFNHLGIKQKEFIGLSPYTILANELIKLL